MKKIFLALIFVVFSSSVLAADLTIEMLNKNPETKKEWSTAKKLLRST